MKSIQIILITNFILIISSKIKDDQKLFLLTSTIKNKLTICLLPDQANLILRHNESSITVFKIR